MYIIAVCLKKFMCIPLKLNVVSIYLKLISEGLQLQSSFSEVIASVVLRFISHCSRQTVFIVIEILNFLSVFRRLLHFIHLFATDDRFCMISRLLVQISLQGVSGVFLHWFWPNVINEVNLSGICLELNLEVFHLDIVSVVANKLHHRANQADTQRWAQRFNRFHMGQLMSCVVRFQIENWQKWFDFLLANRHAKHTCMLGERGQAQMSMCQYCVGVDAD